MRPDHLLQHLLVEREIGDHSAQSRIPLLESPPSQNGLNFPGGDQSQNALRNPRKFSHGTHHSRELVVSSYQIRPHKKITAFLVGFYDDGGGAGLPGHAARAATDGITDSRRIVGRSQITRA